MGNELQHAVAGLGAEAGASLNSSFAAVSCTTAPPSSLCSTLTCSCHEQACQTSPKHMQASYSSQSQRAQIKQREGLAWNQLMKWAGRGSRHAVVSSSSVEHPWIIVRILMPQAVPYDHGKHSGVLVVEMDRQEDNVFRLPQTASALNTFFLPKETVEAAQLDASKDLAYDLEREAWTSRSPSAVWIQAVTKLWRRDVRPLMPADDDSWSESRAAGFDYVTRAWPGKLLFSSQNRSLFEVRDVHCDSDQLQVEVVCTPLEYVLRGSTPNASRWRHPTHCDTQRENFDPIEFDTDLVDYEVAEDSQTLVVYMQTTSKV